MQVKDVIKYGTKDEGRHQKKTWAGGHMGRSALTRKRLFPAQRLRLSEGEKMIM